jgi:hypothetical protein
LKLPSGAKKSWTNISFITRWFPFLIRPPRTKRFEILLPLTYNDGTEIQAEKFDQTAEELCERFGGISEDTVPVIGTWKYGGTRYRDTLFRIRVDTTDRAALAFFKAHKDIWKERFQQLDIWITVHEIDVV